MSDIELVDTGGRVERALELDGARLGVARTRGAVRGNTNSTTAWLLVEGGTGSLAVDGDKADVGGRSDVFDQPGWAAVLGIDSAFELEGDLRATVVWRAWDRDSVVTRVIPPDSVAEEDRGAGANSRRVRTYVAEGPIIAGETLNPPGGWSSYPPHRHEHEEVYLYRFEPATGFGVAVNYGDGEDGARIVRDGAVQRIARGYHPVAAAPGYTMYYLWALAGESETLTPELDPQHAWAG